LMTICSEYSLILSAIIWHFLFSVHCK